MRLSECVPPPHDTSRFTVVVRLHFHYNTSNLIIQIGSQCPSSLGELNVQKNLGANPDSGEFSVANIELINNQTDSKRGKIKRGAKPLSSGTPLKDQLKHFRPPVLA